MFAAAASAAAMPDPQMTHANRGVMFSGSAGFRISWMPMMKWIVGLLLATMVWAATPDAKTEKEVLAALDSYKEALLKRDAAALSKVLSDDLTYTHSSNKHEDKTAVLESLKGSTHTEAIDFKDLK